LILLKKTFGSSVLMAITSPGQTALLSRVKHYPQHHQPKARNAVLLEELPGRMRCNFREDSGNRI